MIARLLLVVLRSRVATVILWAETVVPGGTFMVTAMSGKPGPQAGQDCARGLKSWFQGPVYENFILLIAMPFNITDA